jgi:hypothetical protein
MRPSNGPRRRRHRRQSDLDDGFSYFLSQVWEYRASNSPEPKQRLATWLLERGCPGWLLRQGYAFSILKPPIARVPLDPELAFLAYIGQSASGQRSPIR